MANESPTLSDLLGRLTQLKPADLTTFLKRAQGLAQAVGLGGASVSVVLADDWLLDGLYRELDRRGLKGTMPALSQLPKLKMWKHYAETATPLRTWLEAQFVPPLSRTELLALGQLVAEAYVDRIKRRHKSTAPHMLLSCIADLPDAIDAAFPGYIEAGLFPVVLRTRIGNYLK